MAGAEIVFPNGIPTLAHAWEVLVLFLIPVGGGVPAGVVLAQKYGVSWIVMTILYFISDVILACVFEPLMLLFIHFSHRSPHLLKVREAMKASTGKTVARYGINPGPFSLMMISFGTDPMTGRSVAKAAGHGFLSGWALIIAGDMVFFFVLMVSTLCLNNILGDGTWAAVIITVIVLAFPVMMRKLRGQKA